MLLLRGAPGWLAVLRAPLSAVLLAGAVCTGSGAVPGGETAAPEDPRAASASVERRLPGGPAAVPGGETAAPEDPGEASASITGRLPGGLAAVWATDDGDKIERHDLAHPARLGNLVWNPDVGIDLWALRNETVAFQVVLEGDEAGACCLQVSMSGLQASDGAAIRNDFTRPGADEGDLANSVGRRVEVFREIYLPVKADAILIKPPS